MSTATARAYLPYFAGRFMPFEMRKSPQNKAFYGHKTTYSGEAHCIKDRVLLDPTCGTAGFLISAMHRMLTLADTDAQKKNIKKKQLHGFELQSNMFAVAAANMILRKDGNSNLECCDFLRKNPAQVQLKGATVGLMNPPYSQGTKADPEQYEISFIEHMLDSLAIDARAAVIVPQSSMTGKSKAE
ncbi:hypothetical protein BIFGAL_02943 [Bifidobacterium gallicum DSM 20093 = LMG 11596]|uniref:site-specific DNA-methyltransferase (adenine-specific) n=1 Tax=Bifidobacterium gallicum DSM 20093 = LMG 11596 TaxID=561180 RepID=D1NT32_9BIFI|nr:hypothetical protein BIFGAL_02943 [Bifidobacterium gallicum DSM 20093 = LMG 11596]